jgi:hypothetical protein
MWVTVLITPLISSNCSCWSLYFLSCDLPFWLPLWYLQTFLIGHCIACHVIYRSDYHFNIFKLFLLVEWQAIQWPTRKVWRYQRGNQNGKSHDRQYNDQQEKFEDIKGVIRTVNHMTGNTMTNKKSLKICIACHSSYRSYYPFDIFKLFLLVIVLPVMWFTVLITPLISSNFSCWSLYCLYIKGVIRTVNHMTGNTMTNKKSLKISKR